MTRQEMLRFAEGWIEAWNRRDVEAILHHFTDDARFTSPKAVPFAGSATLRDKAALRDYWTRASQALGTTLFRLDRVICDPARNEMVVLYDRLRDGATIRACEVMRFDALDRQMDGEALYGAEA